MCGWIVVVGRHGQLLSSDDLSRATQSLLHRGPDDSGSCRSGHVAMGFRRLSIIDLSLAGHQPMVSADHKLVLVFNGEIYNHLELRRELEAAGHVFVSRSDTEVLLQAYRHWGPDCVHRFNGMFSFLIHDRANSTLFGARDRLGVKPMYLWQSADWLVFASEPGAIGATGLCALEPDWGRLNDALMHGWMDHGGGTCLAGVRQVPAGHVVTVDSRNEVLQRPYWRLPDEPASEGGGSGQSDEQWTDKLSQLVGDAVRLRMCSDVPVGFTLSGGIDSSLLVCEAAHQGGSGLGAFSFHDEMFDELDLIKETAARSGASVRFIQAREMDVADLLPKVIAANGEPVHSMSALANYALFGLARQCGVTVLLGGQGADEVFAGYSSFQVDYWHTLAADFRWRRLIQDVRRSADLHGSSSARLLFESGLRSLLVAMSGTRVYQSARAAFPRRGQPLKPHQRMFSSEFWRASAATVSVHPEGQRLAQRQRLAASFAPLPMYLRIEDRVSMAHSVEARLPFTDYRLVEHAFRMPDRLKFVDGINKVALRRVAARRVPPAVTARKDKHGFPVGHTAKTAADLQRLCRELVATQAFRERGLYDRAAVEQLLSRPAQVADVNPLFHLAQVELWLSGLRQPSRAPAEHAPVLVA